MDLVIRAVVIIFGLIQTLLGLRLILRFIDPPAALVEYVPALLRITDALIAPFITLSNMVGVRIVDFGVTGPTGSGVFDRVELGVVIALVGWSLLETVVVVVLRLVGRVTPG